MRGQTRRVWTRIGLSYGRKLFLLATLPLVLAVTAILVIVISQS